MQNAMPSAVNVRTDYFGMAATNDVGSRSNIVMDSMSSTIMDDGRNAARKNFFYSNPLDIKQAGKLTDFHVKTEQAEMVAMRQRKLSHLHRKYDFSMSTSLVLADPDDFIFTKIIMISPKYVFVNHMKTSVEVAQVYTEDTPSGK